MSHKKKTVYLFTNVAPHYRKGLWDALLLYQHAEFHFFFGKTTYSGIKTIDFSTDEYKFFKKKLHFLKNIWFTRKVLIWQNGVIGTCLNDRIDTAIFLGEMYCLSTWLASIICRIRGITLVFWGHGFYGNEGKIKMLVRRLFNKLADKHLVYERRGKELMGINGFRLADIYVIFNSLDHFVHRRLRNTFKHKSIRREEFIFFKNPLLPVVIFIGRLTRVKRIDMLINGITEINKKSATLNLLIIGDGPELVSLKRIGKKGLSMGWIHFEGPCYDENVIGRFIYMSDLCVSPGNVGLTAIHSLSFGTPVGTHDNFKNQMPESGIIVDGYNGFFFREDDLDDMINKIRGWFTLKNDREEIRNNCYKFIDQYYNTEYQISIVNRMIQDLPPEL